MRVDKGIAQDAFALAAGVDRSYYGKLERGERQPSLSILLRISAGLGSPGAQVLAAVEQQLIPSKTRPRRKRTV